LNMITLLNQMAERASMQGNLQFGQVPQGKASALRTTANMQSILAQGDARPERILRRFFSGFKDVYRIMHELNQRFLPVKKQYRLMEPDLKGRGVYASVDKIEMISGRMQFMFKAGMFNTDKQIAMQVFQTLMGILFNPLMIQLGIVKPENVYNLAQDFIKLLQQEPTRYITSPQPGAPTTKITAEEVVSLIMLSRMPQATTPAEGYQEHLKKLQGFTQSLDGEVLSTQQQTLLQVYMQKLVTEMQQQQQQQQLLQQAQQFQQQVGGGPGGTPGPQAQGAPPPQGTAGNATVGANELLDESLSTNGGQG